MFSFCTWKQIILIFFLQDSRDASEKLLLSSSHCNDSHALIELSDDEFDQAMAEVISMIKLLFFDNQMLNLIELEIPSIN